MTANVFCLYILLSLLLTVGQSEVVVLALLKAAVVHLQ